MSFIDDIGSPIDSTIEAEIIADETAARNAAAILSPRDGRYLLAIGQKVYVFSIIRVPRFQHGLSMSQIHSPELGIDGGAVACRGDDKLYNGGSDNNTYDYRSRGSSRFLRREARPTRIFMVLTQPWSMIGQYLWQRIRLTSQSRRMQDE